MKWLALLLVFTNVAFFGWRYEQRLRAAREEATVAAPVPPNAPSLQLISELDELPPLREEARQESANATPATAVVDHQGAATPLVPGTAPTGAPAPLPGPPTSAAEIPPTTTAEVESRAPAAPARPPEPSQPAAANPAMGDTPETPTIVSRPATGSGVAADICVSIGPFPDSKNADAIEAWLAPRATALHRVSQVMRKRKFFWVYLEPKSAEEARARVADLERKGVRDYLLIHRDGLKNAISLGLFSTQEAVNRRLSEMNKQGFQPVVVPRLEITDYEWLRANLAVGFTDTNAIPREPLAGAAVQPIDCARIAETSPNP